MYGAFKDDPSTGLRKKELEESVRLGQLQLELLKEEREMQRADIQANIQQLMAEREKERAFTGEQAQLTREHGAQLAGLQSDTQRSVGRLGAIGSFVSQPTQVSGLQFDATIPITAML